MPHPRRIAAALALCALGAAVSGCASTVSLEPAEAANDPACAEVSVRLPDSVDGQERRWTDAQATGAWGDPTAVILTCGVESPAPTEARCITIGGVDWIVDDSEAPRYLLTSYGREPAAQVFLDNGIVSSNEALSALSTAVGMLPKVAECVETSTLSG